MVYHYCPQAAHGSVTTNTNFPPQGGGENANPPVGGTMEYENFFAMEYEDLIDMDYEG